MVGLVSLMLVSCFSFPTLKSKKNPIPELPKQSYQNKEDRKANSAIIQDIANVADNRGVIAHSTTSGTLKACADILVMLDGAPVEKVNWEIKKEVDDLHNRIRNDEENYRKDMDEWMQRIDSLSRDNSLLQKELEEKNGMIATLKRWFWWSCIALGLLIFFFPTLGIPLVRFLVGRAKKTAEVAVENAKEMLDNQLKEVVSAVEEYKVKHPEEAGKLMDMFSKKMDKTTKMKIAALKQK